MSTLPNRPPLMTVQQAALYVSLSASTLNKLRVFGGGPAYLKVTRRIRYDQADLDLWLGSKRKRSTSEI